MSDRAKVALVVGALLALIPLWNFIAEEAANAFRPKQAHEAEHQEHAKEPTIRLPVKEGPPTAVVKVEAFLSGGNPCHHASVDMLRRLAEEYPGQVRVEVYDRADPAAKQRAERLKIGCEMGIVINGRGAFNIPGKGIVMFQGPVDASHDYNIADLRMVVEMLIRQKTGKEPKKAQSSPQGSPPTSPGGTTAKTGH
ncbi:MAG: hypothetical protein H5T86_01660 [Armatimonadetes bacterium]|nr:hypothetical protein [Armatimonadota bacterium]